jgi:hypothetical protein
MYLRHRVRHRGTRDADCRCHDHGAWSLLLASTFLAVGRGAEVLSSTTRKIPFVNLNREQRTNGSEIFGASAICFVLMMSLLPFAVSLLPALCRIGITLSQTKRRRDAMQSEGSVRRDEGECYTL